MRKLNKTKIKKLLFSVAGLLILSFVSGYINFNPPVAANYPAKPGHYWVTEIPDGDTIVVDMDGRAERIRLIGVDTPETIKPNSPQECYGKEASNYLRGQLNGQQVKLEADPINQNRDRYNRLLRYVYLNDLLINKNIIERGYGFAYLSFPFTKSEEFRQAQISARQSNVGVWAGNCQINGPDSERPKTNSL